MQVVFMNRNIEVLRSEPWHIEDGQYVRRCRILRPDYDFLAKYQSQFPIPDKTGRIHLVGLEPNYVMRLRAANADVAV